VKVIPKFIDLTGTKINNWIIKEFRGFNKHGASQWLVECDCNKHTQRIKTVGQIKQRYSCGCYNKENLNGKIFNRWTVISNPLTEKGHTFYLCQCSCDNHNIRKVRSDQLKNGISKSCGCYALEIKTKHGMSKERIYKEWYAMIDRCYNSKRDDYIRYGGRGIIVCEEWIDLKIGLYNFKDWAINNGYDDNLSIERMDVNGNYCPNNCTWITMNEQAKNKRNTIYIETDEGNVKLVDMSKNTGIKRETILKRYINGITSNDLYYDGRLDNTSGVTGVSYCKDQKYWRAYININKKRIELGKSKDKKVAIEKRLQAEYETYGNNSPQYYLFKQYNIGVDNNAELS